ncbi:MAG: hypothetical protein FRX49_09783 [Trebouxia sp. A1-2]|nr:MAG: hypothetical protein FRX49_09783 [Trebouxia sp. A1-2]
MALMHSTLSPSTSPCTPAATEGPGVEDPPRNLIQLMIGFNPFPARGTTGQVDGTVKVRGRQEAVTPYLKGFSQLCPSALIPDQASMAMVPLHSTPEQAPVAFQPSCSPGNSLHSLYFDLLFSSQLQLGNRVPSQVMVGNDRIQRLWHTFDALHTPLDQQA